MRIVKSMEEKYLLPSLNLVEAECHGKPAEKQGIQKRY